MDSKTILLSIALWLGVATVAHGHHSFLSQYDAQTVMTLEGIVTEVWYQNPHSRVYVEITNESGEKELWETETYPRNILDRRGWKRQDLQVGDDVRVTGRRARDGGNRLQILTIVRPSDGGKASATVPTLSIDWVIVAAGPASRGS